MTATLKNTGSVSTSITNVTIFNAEFTRVSGDCPATLGALSPGASCTVGLAFKPTVTGGRIGRLSVTYGNGMTAAMDLTGTGVEVVDNAPSLSFGSNPVFFQ